MGQAIRVAVGGWLLVATVPAAGQQFFVETQQVPLRTAVQQEKQLGSITRPLQRTVRFSTFQLGGPFEFTRPYTGVKPRPVVSYDFSVPDSIVRRIEVTLDSTTFLGPTVREKQAYREPLSRLPAFQHTYNSLKQELIAVLGKPLESEPLTPEGQTKYVSYNQSDSWDSPTVSGELYMYFSTGSSSRIRASITYKNRAVATSQSTNPLQASPQQVAVCERFLALLGAKQFAKSWELLSPEIKNSLSLAQYEAMFRPFVDPVADEQPLVSLLMSGPLTTATGQQLAQYTYLVSGRKAPTTPFRINLLFLDASSLLIAGLQPRYMSAPVLISK